MKYPQLVSMPSAVSDWLEEQLEARGIDAVVYTRYVLSLLHLDNQDLLSSSEHDIHNPKEKLVGSGKRYRRYRYKEWWSHVCADVEQLRRSAAIECLMSASDQKCGIESLVDELCEKLKHFESDVSEKENEEVSKPSQELNTVISSPLELARRYYAAFPPLNKGNNLITLLPQICNKKKSGKKFAQKNRSTSCGDKQSGKCESSEMKSRSGGCGGGKPRVTHVSRKKMDFGFTRSMEANQLMEADWDNVQFLNQQNRADEGYSTSDTNCEELNDYKTDVEDKSLANLVAKFDSNIEALWNEDTPDNQPDTSEYNDLPVDIQKLLQSPTKIELINNQNAKKSLNNQSFIKCGTNIISSIWTDYDRSLYSNYDTDKILGDFSYLSVDNNYNFDYQSDLVKWSDAEINYKNRESLMTLNHNEEISCFKEVVPKQTSGVSNYKEKCENVSLAEDRQEYLKDDEDLLTSARTHFRPIRQESIEGSGVNPGQYADGTTFAIRSSLEHVNYKRSDSGTLYLESEFDTPKKYMEYRVKDTQEKNDDNDSCYSIEREFILKFCVKQTSKCCQTEHTPEDLTSTSPQEVPAKKRVICDPEEFYFPGDEELLSDSMLNNSEEVSMICECDKRRDKVVTCLEPLFNASDECSLHGKMEDKWNWKKCDKCNNNWSSIWLKPEQEGIWKCYSGVVEQQWQQIWSSSEELCRECVAAAPGGGGQGSSATGRSLHYFKLREELSQDGEQLLSDLSCLQRVYMEQLPITEVSCDLTELPLGPPSATKERKRRHSSSIRAAVIPAVNVARNSWTSRAAAPPTAEYLIERPAFLNAPSLRPVTL